jgi:hypothetical protein
VMDSGIVQHNDTVAPWERIHHGDLGEKWYSVSRQPTSTQPEKPTRTYSRKYLTSIQSMEPPCAITPIRPSSDTAGSTLMRKASGSSLASLFVRLPQQERA